MLASRYQIDGIRPSQRFVLKANVLHRNDMRVMVLGFSFWLDRRNQRLRISAQCTKGAGHRYGLAMCAIAHYPSTNAC